MCGISWVTVSNILCTWPLGTQARLAKRMGSIDDALKRMAPPHAAE